ncbi:YciI family protein [Mycobacterium hubeiense]|uniref:YciI family protein n=1 Tax=Mycobacterium hubeiense TaxID=1867256 RepID=UPI000C7F2EB0|nr:YciI family protein [Mycobacterium sp. QGD 101]
MFHVLTLTYLQPLDVIDKTRPAHLDWLKGEVDAGRILLAGRVEDQSGAELISGDMSADDADALIEADPYQQAGLVRYERVSFNGAFRAPGL